MNGGDGLHNGFVDAEPPKTGDEWEAPAKKGKKKGKVKSKKSAWDSEEPLLPVAPVPDTFDDLWGLKGKKETAKKEDPFTFDTFVWTAPKSANDPLAGLGGKVPPLEHVDAPLDEKSDIGTLGKRKKKKLLGANGSKSAQQPVDKALPEIADFVESLPTPKEHVLDFKDDGLDSIVNGTNKQKKKKSVEPEVVDILDAEVEEAVPIPSAVSHLGSKDGFGTKAFTESTDKPKTMTTKLTPKKSKEPPTEPLSSVADSGPPEPDAQPPSPDLPALASTLLPEPKKATMKEEKVSAAAGQGEQPAKATKTGPFKPASPSLSPYAVIDQSPPKEVKSNGVSQRPRKRSVIDPPPPHLPQQHFYQVPDFGLNIAAEDHSGSTSCWRLDSFADAGDVASSKRSRDALLVGFSDALEVYRVLPDRMEVIGRLEGLRGRVVGAKIVPCTQKQDWKRNLRPLVALIIHGPSDDYGKDFDTKGDDIHQTTVDIFSLKTQQHVSTIFKSACVRKQSSGSTSTPVGGLSVDAAGKFITVASGNSGEVYIFSDTSPAESPEPRYECVGKVWTALQHGTRNAGDADATAIPVENRPRKPLMSLRGRWLAIVPPYTAAGTAIHCTPSLPQSKGHVVGMGTVTAPPQPLVTCEVAGIDDEGTLRWLSRKAAQGLVKASQKGVEMGLQGWKELTSPAPSITARVAAPATRTAFPPTNAPAEGSDRLDKEPALVSIIDLEQLLDTELLKPRQAPLPMATFALVEGCNYISLSADGLRLLTSNRHGDMSFIWDLTHMAHGSSSVLADDRPEQGPHVKQVDKVERSSPSVIVDTVWPGPDNWLAILTSHGTIHLHEFQTKPSKKKKRRGTISVPSNKAEATVEVSPGRSPPSSGGLLGGWRSWSQSVSSQAMALKSQYALPTTFAGFKETAAAAGAVSRRAVARGIGQGYMAARSGASDMWHAEDNKVRIKESVEVGSIMWMQWHNDRVLTVATRRQLSLYSVEHVSRQRGEVMVPGLKRHKQPRIFTLPGEAKNNCIGQGPHGFWSLRTADNNGSLKPSNGNTLTAAANDVETNPPYCPFHIDYRLSIYVFRDTYDPYNGQPWTFCAPLPAAVKVNDQQQQQLSRASSVKEFHDVADWEQDDTAMVESHLRIDGGEIFLNSRIKS